ncbi:PEPxxWA-CTERM sorting domain-containing protein [Sandaracinobacter sp. RS1-74]|uniref:PEPxxWA-CTERM sorting domain-containing protein n=1 Tax=Sandaracinobacteroides sayramensis TaxID=2913411 RepID=UPI001EDC05CB|nr:PEPxxWA-CTERM sorting domain-containing protein [Sandaracinobacteroides sayramensis]MCG2840817.1 PEPxxWA-CTERM sorting domain-containing protein [Sandaracinobacteroides sayramensis]
MNRLILAAAAAFVATAPATAAVIQPVAVTASDSFWTYDVNNLINGSGLSGGKHDTNWNNMWQSTWDQVPHWLLFDLGQNVSLKSASIWQYAADFNYPWYETDRGVKDLGISISLDGVNFTSVADAVLERHILNADNRYESFAAQLVEFTGEARYVRFDLNSNYGSVWTGLSEVRFNGSVPEAATWAMMIAGFGLVGGAMRRRRAIEA